MKKKNINTTELNQKVKSLFPLQLQYIFGVYFLGLVFFCFFRLMIFILHCFTSFSDINLALMIRSIFVGIRYDTVVSCYALLPFIIIMIIASLFNIRKRYFYRPIHWIVILVYSLCFLISAIDLPYYLYFSNHFNIVALLLVNSPKFLLNLIIQNPIYLLVGVLYLLSVAAYLWLMYCLYNATLFKTIPPYDAKQKTLKVVLSSLLIVVLCFAGMRGTISKETIKTSDAFFSNSAFFNQLGLSPTFTLVESWNESKKIENQPVNLINDITAKQIVDQEFINRDDTTANRLSIPENSNIILVFVKTTNIPNIMNKSLVFNNIYASSLLYYNNLYSTLFSYPSILNHHPMRKSVIENMKGLPDVLKQKGYRNYYFSFQDRQIDNIAGYLYNNGIDEIVEEKGDIYGKMIETLNKDNSQEPFFACVLTADKSINQSNKDVNRFINKAKRYSWSKKTLFVFIPYINEGVNQENNLSEIEKIKGNVLFYYPKALAKGTNNTLGLQIDIAPTILSMLDKSYKNETMGMNLLGKSREYAYFSTKDEVVVMDSSYQYVFRLKGKESLYKMNEEKRVNYILLYPEIAQQMKTYGLSMLQNAQYRLTQIQIQKK